VDLYANYGNGFPPTMCAPLCQPQGVAAPRAIGRIGARSPVSIDGLRCGLRRLTLATRRCERDDGTTRWRRHPALRLELETRSSSPRLAAERPDLFAFDSATDKENGGAWPWRRTDLAAGSPCATRWARPVVRPGLAFASRSTADDGVLVAPWLSTPIVDLTLGYDHRPPFERSAFEPGLRSCSAGPVPLRRSAGCRDPSTCLPATSPRRMGREVAAGSLPPPTCASWPARAPRVGRRPQTTVLWLPKT